LAGTGALHRGKNYCGSTENSSPTNNESGYFGPGHGWVTEENRFIQDIRAKFLEVQRNPLLYQLHPDIGEEARMATVGNYAILFRVIGEAVRIERVTYGDRDLPARFDPS